MSNALHRCMSGANVPHSTLNMGFSCSAQCVLLNQMSLNTNLCEHNNFAPCLVAFHAAMGLHYVVQVKNLANLYM